MMTSLSRLFVSSLILAFFINIGIPGNSFSQGKSDNTSAEKDTLNWGVDRIFEAARELAYDDKFSTSQKWLKYILEEAPDYTDVRIFLGRTYAWQSKYAQAEKIYSQVLDSYPKNLPARLAYIDILRWQERYQRVIEQCDAGLSYHSSNADLLYFKAQAHAAQGDYSRAQSIIQRLELRHPTYAGVDKLRKEIKEKAILNDVGVRLGTDIFSRTYDPMYYGTLTYGRETDIFSKVNGHLHFARRFEENGVQFEIDSYPTISDGWYAYLAYAYSPSNIFTEHRAGAEIFGAVIKDTELSLGLRYMRFVNGNYSLVYTGSVSYYYKDYWFSLRPFIIPESDGISRSISFTTRRFLNEGTDYLALNLTLGTSPDEQFTQLESQELAKDVLYLESQKAGVEYKKQLSVPYQITARIDVEHQELRFSPGDYVWIYSFSAAFTYRF